MRATTIETEDGNVVLQQAVKLEPDKIDELLVCLDRDIEHMEESLQRLDELRALVVKRDDATLSKLLEGIQAESDDYAANESRRQCIRKELARALGCGFEQVTLSKLEAVLGNEQRAEVAGRKAMLKSLVEKLRKEHLSTALLLSECAKFNGRLLRSVFNFVRAGTVTYNSDGSAKRQTDAAFMNLQF
ncbi:MAG: flagellar export chaperone FlgN [Planctomycetota bacterium]|jgi:hypothetical protein